MRKKVHQKKLEKIPLSAELEFDSSPKRLNASIGVINNTKQNKDIQTMVGSFSKLQMEEVSVATRVSAAKRLSFSGMELSPNSIAVAESS